MPGFHITRLCRVYPYHTDRKSWHSQTCRTQHILAYQMTGHYDHTFSFGLIPVKADTLLFLNQNDAYSVKEVETGSSICVSFEADCDLPTCGFDFSDMPQVRNLFQRLLQHKHIEKESNYFSCMSITYELLSYICKKDEQKYLTRDSAGRVHAAHSYLLEHYLEPDLTVARLAEISGLCSRYFSDLYKNLYGNTPTQYIIDLRIHAAADLLCLNQYSVGEVAELCGFRDIYYFSRQFKQRLHVSPSEFRKQ